MIATIKALPLTQQIQLIQTVVMAPDFADFDQDNLDRLDVVLCSLLSQAREDDYRAQVALHGREVGA